MEGAVTQLSARVSADWHGLKYSATDGAGEAVGKQPPCSCHLSGKMGTATGLEMERLLTRPNTSRNLFPLSPFTCQMSVCLDKTTRDGVATAKEWPWPSVCYEDLFSRGRHSLTLEYYTVVKKNQAVCAGYFYINLTQAKAIREEGTSVRSGCRQAFRAFS